MKKGIIERVNACADYIIETKNTIRETAKKFQVSKSTIHKDIQNRLVEINPEKYKKVNEIFQSHIEIRHIRGGQSTKEKYELKKRET
ncbi:MAG: stage III sporulation protein D [Bacilli bacterium]|nr:stage III sporulation protein D [Bacilli bacterium]